MSYSNEYQNEWQRREELLRALRSATEALSEAFDYERVSNSHTADLRMEALLDHLETIDALRPRQIIQKYVTSRV